jgi:hypothetical protein
VGHMMARRASLTDDERVGMAVFLLVLFLLLVFAGPPPAVSR